MNVKIIYNEETTQLIDKYTLLLVKYEERLNELIHTLPNINYGDYSRLFQYDQGRCALVKEINKIKNAAIPIEIEILDFDSLY